MQIAAFQMINAALFSLTSSNVPGVLCSLEFLRLKY